MLLGLLLSGQRVSGQDFSLPPVGEVGLVNYQIVPLPPVEDIPPPAAPLLDAPADGEEPAASEAAAGEEVEAPKPNASDGEAAAEGDATDAEVAAEIIPAEEPSLWDLWRMWEVGFELGVNGSVGNTDVHTWRTATRSKRKTDFSVLSWDVDYKKSMQEGTTTADRLFSEWRAEFPYPKNKWSYYLHGTVEWDAFRAYDARVAKDAGFGYQWYKTDVGSFITRGGAGTSREFGGPDENWVPEGVLGAIYERKLSRRQKLSFSSEFFFDWTEFGENRLNTKADWEVVLDEEASLSLKVSIMDRYDSTPNGSKPNDLDYSTVLLWSF